jgi:hypothetical protein
MQLSDRRGRVFIMRLNVWSLIIGDILFILVFMFPEQVPGGYYALLVGPVIDGLLGGTYVTACWFLCLLSCAFAQADWHRRLLFMLIWPIAANHHRGT